MDFFINRSRQDLGLADHQLVTLTSHCLDQDCQLEFTAAHHFADVDTWPVDSSGVDLSLPGNHLSGFVSRFAYGSREPFMGVYRPATASGVVHVADHQDMPGKKIWSWGWDDEGKDWRRALSDDESAYLEVQAGLFRNQETYAFLEPQQLLRFRETYQPVRAIGGYSRANDEGVLHVHRGDGRALRVGLNVTRAVSGGRVVVRDGQRLAREDALNLDPSGAFDRAYPELAAAGPYAVEVRDAAGRLLIAHTEGRYDFVPKAEVTTGPQPAHVFPPPEKRSDGDWLDLGTHQELNGKLLEAREVYAAALAAYPQSPALSRAAGRLAVSLKRPAEAVAPLMQAVARRSNDGEALYYLGLAHSALGDTRKARFAWVTLAPLAWLLVVTTTASWQKLFSADPRLGFLAHARRVAEQAAAGEVAQDVARRMIFNDRVDAAVALVFVAVTLLVVASSAREWLAVLGGRKPAVLRETEFTETALAG